MIVGACLTIYDSDDSDNEDTIPDQQIDNSTTAIVPYNPATTAIVPYNPTTTDTVPHNPTTPPPQQRTLSTFQLKPPLLITAITAAEDKDTPRMNLFHHMVTFRNRNGFAEEKQKVSAYLNCECTCDQQKLLNPSVLDTMIGFVMKDSQGEGAKKRLPQRRLNFIDGMISSHCSVLNSTERLALICQANEVSAVMVDLEEERHKKKEEQKRKRSDELAKAKKRREEKEAKEREAKRTGLLECGAIMEKLDSMGEVAFQTMKVGELRALIRYQFNSDEYKKKGILKPELKSIAMRLFKDYSETVEEQIAREQSNA